MRRLVLDYNGGQQTVLVEESTPVTLLKPGQASTLVPARALPSLPRNTWTAHSLPTGSPSG
jgi:hypothetical protein